MKRKGFSTVELIVSFVIVSIVSIAIFKTVTSLMDKINFYQNQSKMTIINGNIINSIQQDLRHRKLYGISECGSNCYDIMYQNFDVRRIKINMTNKTIQYGGVTEKLPSNVKITGDLQLTTQTFTVEDGKHNAILTIFIPLEDEVMETSYSLNVVYQYDNRDIGGLPPYDEL